MNCLACGRRIFPQRNSPDPASRHIGRGLCSGCYDAHAYRGLHVDFERRTRSRDDVLSEWQLLRSEGHSKRQVAERLGMNLAAFNRALQRAAQTPRPALAGRGE